MTLLVFFNGDTDDFGDGRVDIIKRENLEPLTRAVTAVIGVLISVALAMEDNGRIILPAFPLDFVEPLVEVGLVDVEVAVADIEFALGVVSVGRDGEALATQVFLDETEVSAADDGLSVKVGLEH